MLFVSAGKIKVMVIAYDVRKLHVYVYLQSCEDPKLPRLCRGPQMIPARKLSPKRKSSPNRPFPSSLVSLTRFETEAKGSSEMTYCTANDPGTGTDSTSES